MTQEKEIPPFYVFEEIETNSYLTKMIQNAAPDKSGGQVGAPSAEQTVAEIREEMERLLVTVAEADINEAEGGPRIFIQGGKRHINLRKSLRVFFEVCVEKLIPFRSDPGAAPSSASTDVTGKILEVLISFGLRLKEAITSLKEADINTCIVLHNALFRYGVQEAVRQVGVTHEQVSAVLAGSNLELSQDQLSQSLERLSDEGVIRRETVGSSTYYNFFSLENPPQPK